MKTNATPDCTDIANIVLFGLLEGDQAYHTPLKEASTNIDNSPHHRRQDKLQAAPMVSENSANVWIPRDDRTYVNRIIYYPSVVGFASS